MNARPVKITGAILAAGKSQRMGQDKLALAAHDGQSILQTVIEAAETSTLEDVFVMFGETSRRPTRQNTNYRTIRSDNMADSVKAAMDYAVSNSATHIMVILADMPAVTVQDINSLLKECQAAPNAIIRAAHDNKSGNPVILPLCYAEQFKAQLTGDEGARSIFEAGQFDIVDVECSAGVLIDIDTPELYQAYLRG